MSIVKGKVQPQFSPQFTGTGYHSTLADDEVTPGITEFVVMSLYRNPIW